jgi:hypothetical protein
VKGDRIATASSLALHCQPKAFLEMDDSGNPTGVNIDAFRVDEDGISTNWIEYEGGDFQSVCQIFRSIREVKKSHRVGVMNVGAIENVGDRSNASLRAIHDPIDAPNPNPGHSLIIGVRPEDSELLLALTTIVDLRPFISPA